MTDSGTRRQRPIVMLTRNLLPKPTPMVTNPGASGLN